LSAREKIRMKPFFFILRNDMISRFAFLFFDSRKIDWLDGGRKIWNWFLFSSFFFFFFVLFPARSSCACRKCVFLLHLIAYFRLIGYWGGGETLTGVIRPLVTWGGALRIYWETLSSLVILGGLPFFFLSLVFLPCT
jgi:hypothetical protein